MSHFARQFVSGLLIGLAMGVGWAQDQESSVAAAAAALEQGSVSEVAAWCDRLIVPEDRGQADDTVPRLVLHRAVMAAGPSGPFRDRLAAAFCLVLTGDRPSGIKDFILEQLQFIAGEDCLAAVTPLLGNDALSDPAVRVVAAIGTPTAAAALAAALPASHGGPRLSLVNALALLPHPEAVPDLLRLAASPERDLRLAALTALAATGDARAGDVLLAATQDASRYARAAADEAYIAFLGRRIQAGHPGEAAAAAIAFADGRREHVHIQCACLEILSKAGGEAAVDAVLGALSSSELRVQLCAARGLRRLDAGVVGPRLAAMVENAAPEQRCSILALLGEIAATGALPVVRRQVDAEDAAVRAAAVLALARIAGVDALGQLAALLTDDREGVASAAADAVAALSDPAAGGAIAALLATAEAPTATVLLRLLARRLDLNQAEAALAALGRPEAEVRAAAWETLGALGNAAHVAALTSRLLGATEPRDIAGAQKALMAVCRRAVAPDVCGPALAAAIPTAPVPAKAALLAVLPAAGGEAALNAARTALEDADDTVRATAVRALADWPDGSALPILEELVRRTPDQTHYVLAYRGLVRLLGQEDAPVAARLERYERAMTLARRSDERKLALGGLGTLQDRAAFAALLPFLADAELKSEAAAAVIQLAQAVRGDDSVQALRRVIASDPDEATAGRAREALNDIAKFAGCVATWEISGPYTDGDKGHTAIFPVVFPPESAPAEAKWRRVTAEKDGRLDLLKEIGGSNRCAYMRTNLIAPAAAEALIDVGSDDGVKVWLNGTVIHENNVPRAFKWCEDSVAATLREGTNTLLLKVTQGGGDWAANARVRAADGTPIGGLNFAIGEPVTAAAAPAARPRLAEGAPTAEAMGWRLAIQCWTFNRTTLAEAVDRAVQMGVRYLELYPGQKLSAGKPDWQTNQNQPEEATRALREQLAAAGVQAVAFGVTGVPGDEPGRRKLFEWAKSMGVETVCVEPDPKTLPELDALCAEYGIRLALHNHPAPSRYWNPQTVLDACDGRSARIGACADTGHWMRSGIVPLDAVKLLGDRIVSFHFKDLDAMGKEGRDVPWGTGSGDVLAVLRQLHRQGFRGVFSIEYERNWDSNTEEVATCVRHFEAMARQIGMEEDGRWEVLFNMRDLQAWHNGRGEAPATAWAIDRGDLLLRGKGGMIWTRERLADFELDLEFNTTGNSGVFFRTDNPGDPVQTGIEVQVDRPGGPGRHSVGALYDLVAPGVNAGREGWNRLGITAQGSRIAVVLNGQPVAEMDLDRWDTPGANPDGTKNKFRNALKDFKREGHIGFQDHGSEVRYRNIRLRRL